MRRLHAGLLGVLGVMALGGVLTTPSTAQACSVSEGIYGSMPLSGTNLAADSRLFLSGAFDPAHIVIEIDDEESPTTELVRDPDFPSRGFESAYLLDPYPIQGSTVTLYHCTPGQECDGSMRYTWTVVAPDIKAPQPIEDLDFGIYDHQDVDTSGDSCGSGVVHALTLYADARLPVEDGLGTTHYALVEVLDASTEQVQASRLYDVNMALGELKAQVSVPDGVLGEPLRESACMQVTILDLAGFRSEAVRACDPHHVVADEEQEPDGSRFDPPPEPAWDELTEVDTPTAPREGCDCRAGGRGAPLLLSLPLLLLGLGARRRRSATQSRIPSRPRPNQSGS